MRSFLLFSLLAFAPLRAGVINTGVISGPATGSVFAFTPSVNNDNVVGASPNNFVAFVTLNGMGVSILNPVGVASNGTTEYRTFLSLTNNTGLPLYGVLLELYDAGGVLVTSNGYDFDFPDFDSGNTAPPWLLTLLNAGQIQFEGSDLQNGFSINLNFNLDYPDPGSGGRFMTITPLSAVPEPSSVSIGLLGLAAVTLGWVRRR